jgi:DUF4097 and DUF4098 domain-containing protein YvlB
MVRRVLPLLALVVGLAPTALAAVEGRFERTLAVNGAVSLSVATGSGGIEITSGPDGSVRVTGEVRANRWTTPADELARAVKAVEANPPIVQEGNTIRIGLIEDQRIARLVSITYSITVPRQTSVTGKTGSGSQSIPSLAGPVSATSGSGALEIGAIDGAVDARTGSGSIRIERAGRGLTVSSGSGSITVGSVAGNLRARTGSAAIDVQQVVDGTAELSSGSGHVNVANLQGGMRASTSSSSIHVSGTPAADWHATTSSGAIRLEIPAGTPFRLRAHTSSGSIRTDHALQTTVTGKRDLEGSTGTGGVLVEARSSSGSITVGRR